MDNAAFSRAYSEFTEKHQPHNLERRELLEQPRQWMRFFNDTLYNYLSGEPAPDPQQFLQQITDYYEWTVVHMEPTAKRLNQLNESTAHQGYENDFSFHRLNSALIPLWGTLVDEESHATPAQLTEMQRYLALQMTPLAREFLKLAPNHYGEDDTPEGQQLGNDAGILSEADTLVALLEMMKTHPELVALPAPSRFEDRLAAHNIDVILIDTAQRQARGIQVKTHLSQEDFDHYDSQYVSLVDGSTDLGNTTLGESYVHRRARPGQLLLEVLANTPIQYQPEFFERSAFLQNRQIARELMRGRKPFLQRAMGNISERLLYDLYA